MARLHASFAELMARIGNGSEEAVCELIENYSDTLRRAVRRRLKSDVRVKVESNDISQSVWCSFLAKRTELQTITTPEQLLEYLVGMAKLKAAETHRRYITRKGRDIRREIPLPEEGTEEREAVEDQVVRHRVQKTGKTPSAISEAKERWERAVTASGDFGRRAVQMRLRGHTHKEIADELGTSRSRIQRTFQLILASLRQ